ncbi:helix-turn-helix domain-containing protein [Novosphingobium sp. G106]|uniref:helix-turn-helix domain-containing protein n=1 Tax=Novosphingobium sp. G106 TaxID=2849500 RepID=UPI001C2D4C80|nr:helix-turn-helix domain-containing protein [Novosphingobium sp. G106]MBV1687439.1 helix-turn-helix domain-containing protein [Novosphingobium sp. G106]
MDTSIEPLADTVEVAATRLSICRAELYKQIAAGRLVARKVGRRTLIERTEQARWLSALPLKAAHAA